jgi:phosphohistidine phosphatase
MSLRLILMRHAKSSWGDPLLDDFDRCLNARGKRDAPRIGNWLDEQGFSPEDALCSSAVRAKETLDGLGLKTPVMFLPELYLAAPARLLGAIQAAYSGCLLVVAHNPGIATLAADLCASEPDHARFRDFPTASTLVLDFDVDNWSDIQPKTGQPRAFVTPHDIT